MPKPTERTIKKARIAQAIDAKRVKGSPRPAKAHKLAKETKPITAKAQGKGKERAKESQTIGTLEGEDLSSSRDSALPRSFKIIAGSYEKLLYGLEGTFTSTDSDGKYTINVKPIFIFPAHVSCIKAVASSPTGGKWLATGSADEIVKVWDLRRRKEIGGLMHHEGSITHLSFPSRSHLLSASEDGTLCLFRARDWAVLRSLKGHKGRVNSVAVHPSGKVALSVGKDKTLRMWDLMRGKGSASTKLGKEGELVRWNATGSLFVVQSQATLDIYSTKMALLHTITHPSRLHDIKFAQRVSGTGELLLVAAEDKKLSIYQIADASEDEMEPPTIIAEMVGHTNRVKAVETLEVALPDSLGSKDSGKTIIVCTISSDGKILVYDLADVPAELTAKIEIHPKAEYDTKGTRLTCVTIAEGEAAAGQSTNGKRKRVDDEATGEGDGEEGSEGEEWTVDAQDEVEEEGEDDAEIEEVSGDESD